MNFPPIQAVIPGRRAGHVRRGFTLVELLVVMAIILVLIGLTVPAFNSISKGTVLTSAGNQVVNMANLARQTAMAHNSMAALIFKDAQAGSPSQSFALFELVPHPDGTQPVTSDWKQVGRWETVPDGAIVAKCSLQDTSAGGSAVQPSPNLPTTINFNGTAVSAYKYAVFMPVGGLYNDLVSTVQLAQGKISKTGAITRTGRVSEGQATNNYTVNIVAATGRTHADRNVPTSSL